MYFFPLLIVISLLLVRVRSRGHLTLLSHMRQIGIWDMTGMTGSVFPNHTQLNRYERSHTWNHVKCVSVNWSVIPETGISHNSCFNYRDRLFFIDPVLFVGPEHWLVRTLLELLHLFFKSILFANNIHDNHIRMQTQVYTRIHMFTWSFILQVMCPGQLWSHCHYEAHLNCFQWDVRHWPLMSIFFRLAASWCPSLNEHTHRKTLGQYWTKL